MFHQKKIGIHFWPSQQAQINNFSIGGKIEKVKDISNGSSHVTFRQMKQVGHKLYRKATRRGWLKGVLHLDAKIASMIPN